MKAKRTKEVSQRKLFIDELERPALAKGTTVTTLPSGEECSKSTTMTTLATGEECLKA